MEEAGIFGEDERVELLRGALVEVSPPSPQHDNPIEWLNMRLVPWAIQEGFSIRPQLALVFEPIDSVPLPDLAVVRRRPRTNQHPVVADRIIEVSVSSRRIDLGLKAGIYAEAGIPEYWVIDESRRLVVTHADPRGSVYARVEQVGEGATLRSPLLPNFPALPVAEIFDGDLG